MTQFVVPLVVGNIVQAASYWPGGQGIMAAAASAYGGATVTLQYQLPDGVTFLSTTTTLAANGVSAAFTLPPGKIQVTVTGGTTTALVCSAFVIPTNLN